MKTYYHALLFVFITEVILVIFILTVLIGQWKLEIINQRKQSLRYEEMFYKASVLCKNGLKDFNFKGDLLEAKCQ